MITIKDVAKRAGVSIATVSRVLNGNPHVSEDTRKKVLKAVRELGYRFKVSPRKIDEISKTVGVLIPNLIGYHYPEIVMGAEEELWKNGFDLLVSMARDIPDVEYEMLEDYFKRKVDGVIVCTPKSNERKLEIFIKSGIPVVAVDHRIEEVKVDSVNIDNVLGAYKVMKYLYENGHRKILFMRGLQNVYSAIDREKGVLKFRRKHPDVELKMSPSGTFEPDLGYEFMKRYLKKNGLDITAIFCASDYTALGVISCLADEGIDVPNDVSIVGFDDSPFAPYMVPPLTTMSQPRREMGRIGAQLLIDRINSKNTRIFRRVVLPVELVERKSVRKIS